MAGQTRLLKANATRELGANVVFNYEDLQKQCDDYLERVKKQAAEIIADANDQAKQIRSVALKEGTEKGFSQGVQNADEQIQLKTEEKTKVQVSSQIQTILPTVENISRMLENEKEKWIAEWEKSAVQLVISIAEKIICKEIEFNPEISKGMIKNALELAAGQRHIIVSLNPGDVEILGDKSGDVISVLAGCGQAEIKEDESVSSGGCVIESRQGKVDARLETQLERIASELLSMDD